MAAPRRIRWGWLSIVGVILVFLFIPPLRGLLSRSVITFSRPLVTVGQWTGDTFQFSGSSRQLRQERDNLQRQVTELTDRVYQSSLQLETVSSLQALTAFGQAAKRTLVTSAVIAASPDPGIQSIVIDRGSDQGIKAGLVVVSERGYVVGKVITVHQAFSTVLLIPDRQSVLAARIQNPAQSSGVVRGERGLALQMGFIPKNDEVQHGQTVVTTGTEPSIPPDLLIGTIASTNLRTGDLFQQAIITPAAAFQRLRVVAVVIQ